MSDIPQPHVRRGSGGGSHLRPSWPHRNTVRQCESRALCPCHGTDTSGYSSRDSVMEALLLLSNSCYLAVDVVTTPETVPSDVVTEMSLREGFN